MPKPNYMTRVIPCLDVKDGRVVKGASFVNLEDAGDPVALAQQYEAAGADALVFLDISATNEKRATVVDLVRRVSEKVFIPFSVGGGIQSLEDAQAVLDSGADAVAVNSAALERPDLLSELVGTLGGQSVILAIDAKRSRNDRSWEAYRAGGMQPTGMDVIDWAKQGAERGIGEILLTSIDRDGQNNGYDMALTQAVSRATRVPIIASGGAGQLEHFSHVLLEGEASAVLCASTLHQGRLTIAQIKTHLASKGIAVRPIPECP